MSFREDNGASFFNPIALRTAKTLWSFGLSVCNRVNVGPKFSNIRLVAL